MDFQIGDRVMYVGSYETYSGIHYGDTGEIIEFPIGGIANIRWDRLLRHGHGCGGKCEYGYGWSLPLDKIGPVSDNIDVDVSDYL